MKSVVIGITGGFGTGKTTVARMFGRLGAKVLDADKIAHGVILPGSPIYKKVISLFGPAILTGDKKIDRRRLASIVFSDKKKLMFLNTLIHPEVTRRITATIERKDSRGKVFVVDVPLLVEAGIEDMFDEIIVVVTDRKTEIQRCISKWRLSKAEIEKRIRSQMPLSKKRRAADFIIDNNGSMQETKKAVEKIWREIRNE